MTSAPNPKMQHAEHRTNDGSPSCTPATARRSNQLARKHRTDTAANWLVFLIPFLRFVQFRTIGLLSGSDILLVLVFLYLFFTGKMRLGSPTAKKVVFFCFVWLASQIVTDIVRHSAFADYSRGWSNIGLTIVNFIVFFTLLYGHGRRLELYGWGLAAGSLAMFLFNPSEFMQEEPWKFGLSGPVSYAIFLYASRATVRPLSAISLTAFAGVLNLALGARNMGGTCLLACLLLMAAEWFRRRRARGLKVGARLAFAATLPIVIGAVAILAGYKYAARSGLFGEDAQQKDAIQSSGRFGTLLGGRPTILGAEAAIYDSPILGHGSWARDPLYVFLEHRALQRLGYKEESETLQADSMKTGLIPAHSYILGAWVFSGVLGAFFWVWVFILTINRLLRLPFLNPTLAPFAAVGAFGLLWDILFSPYGSEVRIISPFFVVLLISCTQSKSEQLIPAAKRLIKSSAKRKRIGSAYTAQRKTATA